MARKVRFTRTLTGGTRFTAADFCGKRQKRITPIAATPRQSRRTLTARQAPNPVTRLPAMPWLLTVPMPCTKNSTFTSVAGDDANRSGVVRVTAVPRSVDAPRAKNIPASRQG